MEMPALRAQDNHIHLPQLPPVVFQPHREKTGGNGVHQPTQTRALTPPCVDYRPQGRGTTGGGANRPGVRFDPTGERTNSKQHKVNRKQHKMPRQKPLNCGNETHPLECLCDVIIKETKPITATIPYDLKFGPEVCEHLGLGVPWTGADLADFFEALAKVQELAHRPSLWGDRKVYSMKELKKMNAEQLFAMKEMIRSGMMPTPVLRKMESDYGVIITRSYVAKTKTRMIQRGEFYAD